MAKASTHSKLSMQAPVQGARRCECTEAAFLPWEDAETPLRQELASLARTDLALRQAQDEADELLAITGTLRGPASSHWMTTEFGLERPAGA